MSQKVLTNIDLSLNQLLGVLLENLAADPTGGGAVEGRVYADTVNHKLRYHNGSGWRSFYLDSTPLNSITAPSADVSINSHKLTNVTDPTAAQDAATKNYVDSLVQGLSPKDSARVATTANIALTGTQTIDGIAVIAGDRVLVKNQTAPAENGLYVVAAGAWSRATDADTANELEAAAVWVEEGTANVNTLWTQTAVNFTLGTDPVTWTQFSGIGSLVGGAGLTLTGNTLDVNVDNSTIEISSDTLRVKDGGITGAKLATGAVDLAGTKITGTLAVGNGGTGSTTAAGARSNLGATTKYSADITGDGAALTFNVDHNLGTKDVLVQVFEATTDALVITDLTRSTTNRVVVGFAQAPANGKVYRVVVVA